MARIISFTCHPHVYQWTEWTIPAFAFPAKAGPNDRRLRWLVRYLVHWAQTNIQHLEKSRKSQYSTWVMLQSFLVLNYDESILKLLLFQEHCKSKKRQKCLSTSKDKNELKKRWYLNDKRGTKGDLVTDPLQSMRGPWRRLEEYPDTSDHLWISACQQSPTGYH